MIDVPTITASAKLAIAAASAAAVMPKPTPIGSRHSARSHSTAGRTSAGVIDRDPVTPVIDT